MTLRHRLHRAARWLPLLLGVVLSACAPLRTLPLPRAPVAPSLVSADRIAGLVNVAEHEWLRWGAKIVYVPAGDEFCLVLSDGRCGEVDTGCGQEQTARLCPVVDEYWAAVSNIRLRHSCRRVDVCEAEYPADASDPPERTPPWSAAFISALMHKAGFRDPEFLAAAAHADYVVAARDGTISAFDVVAAPAPAAPGDLVCSVRGAVELLPSEIDQILDGRRATPMHCDIVVKVDPARRVLEAIGGNVQQTVARSVVELDPLGRISHELNSQRRWVLVMRIRRAWSWLPLD